MNYSIPRDNEERCQRCNTPVRRLHPVVFVSVLMIDSQKTPVRGVKKVCARCKMELLKKGEDNGN